MSAFFFMYLGPFLLKKSKKSSFPKKQNNDIPLLYYPSGYENRTTKKFCLYLKINRYSIRIIESQISTVPPPQHYQQAGSYVNVSLLIFIGFPARWDASQADAIKLTINTSCLVRNGATFPSIISKKCVISAA